MSALLETRQLSMNFGGLMAVDNVSLSVEAGEIRAIIGPNGAGKTTLVGTICGRLRPSGGQVLFEGIDITRMAAHRRVRRGIVYTFQVTSVFKRLTCRDNVALAAQRHMFEFGTTSAQLAEIKVAASVHAQHNPNAFLPNVVTVDEVLESPMVADPLHRLDSCVITDGGGALVVVSPEVAASLGRTSAVVLGAGGPGLDEPTMRATTRRVRIPIHPEVDSLNVGHAAAITFAALGRNIAP